MNIMRRDIFSIKSDLILLVIELHINQKQYLFQQYLFLLISYNNNEYSNS